MEYQSTFFDRIACDVLSIHYQLGQSPRKRISEVFEAYSRDVQAGSRGMTKGSLRNLYAICLPKALFEDSESNCLYHSRPFGQPWNPSDLQSVTTTLKTFHLADNAQGGILAAQLIPESGVKVFTFSCQSKQPRDRLRSLASSLAAEIGQELGPRSISGSLLMRQIARTEASLRVLKAR